MAEWELIPSDHQKKNLETVAQNPGVEFLHLLYSDRSAEGRVTEVLVFQRDETMVEVWDALPAFSSAGDRVPLYSGGWVRPRGIRNDYWRLTAGASPLLLVSAVDFFSREWPTRYPTTSSSSLSVLEIWSIPSRYHCGGG